MDRIEGLEVIAEAVTWPASLDVEVKACIAKWDDVQFLKAYLWAAAFRIRTISSAEVHVPEEPLHVFELRKQVQLWRGDRAEDIYRIPEMKVVER